jgi:hypothetical protein
MRHVLDVSEGKVLIHVNEMRVARTKYVEKHDFRFD